jgi:hypothetical protein
MNGPAQTIAGQLVSLNTNGVIVEGKGSGRSGRLKTTLLPQMNGMEERLETSMLKSATSRYSGRNEGEMTALKTPMLKSAASEDSERNDGDMITNSVGTEDALRGSTGKKSAAFNSRHDRQLSKMKWFGVGWCLFNYLTTHN